MRYVKQWSITKDAQEHVLIRDVLDADGEHHQFVAIYHEHEGDSPESLASVHQIAVNSLEREVARLKQPTTDVMRACSP